MSALKNSSGLCLLMLMCPGVPEWSGSEMRFIGYVEISEEASLDDLKTQVGITTHSINDSSSVILVAATYRISKIIFVSQYFSHINLAQSNQNMYKTFST